MSSSDQFHVSSLLILQIHRVCEKSTMTVLSESLHNVIERLMDEELEVHHDIGNVISLVNVRY